MINLYFDKKDNVYYFNDITKACDSCGLIINDSIFIRVFWDKLGSGANYLCMKCSKKKVFPATFTEEYTAIIESDVPSKAIPIVFSKPTLSASRNIMNVDAAAMNLDGEIVIDKTVYANRQEPKVKEYLIEAEEEDIALKLDNKPLSDTELDNFFTTIKSSVPMIESNDKRLLE